MSVSGGSQIDELSPSSSSHPRCDLPVIFSADGKHILSGGEDNKISEWAAKGTSTPTPTTILHMPIAHLLWLENTPGTTPFEDAIKHSALVDRLYLQGHRPLRTRPRLGGKDSIRRRIHVHQPFSSLDKGGSNSSRIFPVFQAIALFSADQHDEAMLLIKELAAAYPTTDIFACRVVETYICVQLGIKAFDSVCHDEAADHFTAAVNSGAFSSKYVREIYEELTMLFGWDLKSLCLTTHQKRCQAFLSAGKPDEAHKFLMDAIDESAKASCLDWSDGNSFKQECSAFCAANGDGALFASNYDRAIDLYSAAINSNSASDVVFANRSKAKLGKMLWMEALLDAQKVIELDSIQTFQMMLLKTNNPPNIQTRKLRQQYLRPSEVECAIRQVINAQLDNAPLRVLYTTTSLLYDREAQISAFKMSIEYKELVSSTIMHPDLHMKRIEKWWEGKEPLLQDIQGKGVYDSELDMAWSDTCCTDKSNNVELQESVNSMFVWYNSCLPASITSCQAPPCKLSLLPEDQIRISVSLLRKTVAVDFASNLQYTELRNMSAPEAHFTYEVKADGLHDLLITTKETLVQFWPLSKNSSLSVPGIGLSLLELPDFAGPPNFMEPSDFGHDTESEEECWTPPSSP
ncbi:hypothetical protein EV702DRAFT_1215441 [Suillus placidus]|uniref:Uncharacterized protein n=1 Tax=Suillus placidus TaxID=48579 RepID=A0A9P7CWP6_9AGAM|nr:hypothetical protein EV702DRAFT_1215441 [Suillus placidus]